MTKPMFDTREALEAKIDEYFHNCEEYYQRDSEGNIIEDEETGKLKKNPFRKPSIVGLALHLGYASRQSIYDLEKGNNEEYSYIIKRAKSRVEMWVLNYAMEDQIPNSVGIFLLKQFGYTDKIDVKADFNKDKSLLEKLIGG